ncbi:MAG: HAMP domain-containing histidine kinase [Bdellovibrionales bacterium]|nr:HAMP domain-containing histidine kinase [Bdellovibrionales bacterium]
MKLEKVVSRPRKGLWIILFILGLLVAGVMAAIYNAEIVRDVEISDQPWSKIVLGSLGFIGIMGALVLFFARLLREMKVSQIQADFLDRISHELRTPLSTLTLVSDLLRNQGRTLSAEEERLWRSHSSELERLKADVELLLQAARLREARLRVNLQRIDLNQWIRDQWEGFHRLLGANARLSISGDPFQRQVELDPVLLELIFRNLLDNARKFAMGNPDVEFKIRTLRSRFFFGKTRWRIAIVDQGRGFSPEQEASLFQRFSRLEQESEHLRTHSIPGTGLGLYLSATAAKGMGLTLNGKSFGEGKGARFVLEGSFK